MTEPWSFFESKFEAEILEVQRDVGLDHFGGQTRRGVILLSPAFQTGNNDRVTTVQSASSLVPNDLDLPPS